MLASQTHALRTSEIRKRLSELAAVEEMTDEQRSEIGMLRVEYADVEVKYQAAVTAEDTPTETRSDDAEGRELRSLIDGSDVGAIFSATLEHRQTDGRTAELQQHYGLGWNQDPLTLLETRDVTPAPGQVGQNQSAIIPGMFPMSCAAYRASGWIHVGATQGRGRYDRDRQSDKPKKDVWLRPLRRDWKRTLNR